MPFEIGLLVFPNITQLDIEYDPAPPFVSRSPQGAASELVARTREAAKARQDERLQAVRQAAAKLAS